MLLNNLAKIWYIAAILKMAAIWNMFLAYFDCSFLSNYLNQFWTSNIKHNKMLDKQSSETCRMAAILKMAAILSIF
jgi:hypothetical protein